MTPADPPDPTQPDLRGENAGTRGAVPHIVVLGAGFGGLTFARSFKASANAHITIIDRENHHLFQPLLYQVATAALAAPEIAEPVRHVLRRKKHVDVVMDSITSIDLGQRVVRCKLEDYAYDYLVIALGGRTSYFGNEHWEEHAPGLKSLGDAFRIRKQMLTAFELAETVDDVATKRRLMRTVVIGGGPTGVELAGAMADLTRKIFKRDFRHIDPALAEIHLIDGGDRLLKAFPDELSESAKRQLERMGVKVRLKTRVIDIQHDLLTLRNPNGDEVPLLAANILWGGGVVASPLTRSLGVETDRAGRIVVGPDLSIPGHPNAYAIGDLASVTDADGKAVPGVAPAATQMGKHVARNLSNQLVGAPDRRPFRYTDKGIMATIGRNKAVAYPFNKLKLSGFPAWCAWLFVHIVFLIGFRNKVVTLIQWFYQYVTFRSGARIIPSADRTDPAELDTLRAYADEQSIGGVEPGANHPTAEHRDDTPAP